ncbi:MAG: RNA polymerase sigma-70 factor (ECF subfamily) [Candidatus Latescibacterota bacterium]|jgi:RNA polymerase sigma-70 factor (ECF subfamily)
MRQQNHKQLSDPKLVACVLNGDKEAYSELVNRHHVRIYQMAYNLVGSSDDADDLAQLVFLKAFRSLHRFQGNAQFSTWLYRICVNGCYDWMKANKRWAQGVGDDDWWAHLSADDALFCQDDATDQSVIDREMQDALNAALQKLVPEFRLVVILREVNGLAYEEIAEVVGCQVGTVKSRLFRARVQLRKLLAPIHAEWQAA